MDPDEYKKMREENEGNFTGIGAQLDTNKKGEVYIKEPLPDTPADARRRQEQRRHPRRRRQADQGHGHRGRRQADPRQGGHQGQAHPDAARADEADRQGDRPRGRAVPDGRVAGWPDEKNKIGYIRLYQFNEQSDEQFDKALTELEKKHMKGLVFDLRGNPGGLLQVAVDIGSRFIESGPVVIIQERGGQKNPLYVEEDKHNHKRYPLVVLVDKSSASASEIVSGAIKDDGVGTLVGITTFGKGRVQTIMPLQDGSAVAITTAKYLTPNGTDIHKKGIEPDVTVEAAENLIRRTPRPTISLPRRSMP